MRVTFEEMYGAMKDRLIKYGCDEEIAEGCARNLAENSLGGVYSHGLNRFPRVIAMLENGKIKPGNRPARVEAMGALEKWDGGLGMGNTNAAFCMDRAVQLAKQYGIGCVALAHTNHWQRGGAFGIRAAKAGCVGVCWTNTMPNMPAWGAKDPRIGNNPLVFCVPYKGEYVMMDGAMAQFSYGAMDSARAAGRQLSAPGGYDADGNLTTDPAAVEETRRALPIGFWKGSGISVLLDMMAASLSGGMAVCDIGKHGSGVTDETDLSQIFIAIDVRDKAANDAAVSRIIGDIKASGRADADTPIYYPGEKSLAAYRENVRLGIPVDEEIWKTVLSL